MRRILLISVAITAAVTQYKDGEEVGTVLGQAYVPPCAQDPNFPVCTRPGLIPRDACDEFIAAAERDGGYDFGYDSLDGKPAVQIDIVENHKIQFPHLYAYLEPHMEKLTEFAQEMFDVSFIYWIFFRRYSADGNHGRKSVRVHSDSSGATAVIILNDGFQGGDYSIKFGDEKYNPELEKGMGIIHDGFIKHGVEPVTNGTRYSLIVFFAVGKVQATFTNHESEDILVYWQNPDADAEVLEVRIAPGENAGIISHPEHVHKVRFESGELVATWTMMYSPEEQAYHTGQSQLTAHNSDVGCVAKFTNDSDEDIVVTMVGGTEGRVGYLGDVNVRLSAGESAGDTVSGKGSQYVAKNTKGSIVATWVSECGNGRKYFSVSGAEAPADIDAHVEL